MTVILSGSLSNIFVLYVFSHPALVFQWPAVYIEVYEGHGFKPVSVYPEYATVIYFSSRIIGISCL